jgi:hypothetical protein
MIATWGFFVKLHPFYYFVMSYVFGFFFTKKKSYSKLCSPAKIGYKRGKKKVGKN